MYANCLMLNSVVDCKVLTCSSKIFDQKTIKGTLHWCILYDFILDMNRHKGWLDFQKINVFIWSVSTFRTDWDKNLKYFPNFGHFVNTSWKLQGFLYFYNIFVKILKPKALVSMLCCGRSPLVLLAWHCTATVMIMEEWANLDLISGYAIHF